MGVLAIKQLEVLYGRQAWKAHVQLWPSGANDISAPVAHHASRLCRDRSLEWLQERRYARIRSVHRGWCMGERTAADLQVPFPVSLGTGLNPLQRTGHPDARSRSWFIACCSNSFRSYSSQFCYLPFIRVIPVDRIMGEEPSFRVLGSGKCGSTGTE